MAPVWGASRRAMIVHQMSEIVRQFVVERSQSEALGEDTTDILLRDGMDVTGVVNVSPCTRRNKIDESFILAVCYAPNFRWHDHHWHEWYSVYLIL